MMETEILKLLTDYGLEAIVIALAINVLTGLVKLPVKGLAKKMEDGTKLTRYLVFLPVLLGFVLTVAYVKIRRGTMGFDKAFVTLWLTSSSLSLTLYAIFEKFFPSKEKILKDYEIEANKNLIEEIKMLTTSSDCRLQKAADEEGESEKEAKQNTDTKETVPVAEHFEPEIKTAAAKIVLRGKRNDEIETDEKSA